MEKQKEDREFYQGVVVDYLSGGLERSLMEFSGTKTIPEFLNKILTEKSSFAHVTGNAIGFLPDLVENGDVTRQQALEIFNKLNEITGLQFDGAAILARRKALSDFFP